MTLCVTAYLRNTDGTIEDLTEIGSPESLAGSERWRHDFYGSEKMKSLGASILPCLSREDIWAEGIHELDMLESEINVALLHFSETSYQHRLGNILNAIKVARTQGSGVHIG